MKQTIDDLSQYACNPHPKDLTEEDLEILHKYFSKKGGGYHWEHYLSDMRDAAFMAALTSKAGMPYIAKLTALRLEGMNDKLLKCAEVVGKVVVIKPQNTHGSITEGVWMVDEQGWYNPLTNDAQAMELLKVFSDKDIDIVIYGAERVNSVNHGTKQLWGGGGQTLNEAIINAVCAMEGE